VPLTDRERELLSLLDTYRAHLQQQLAVDPATVEPFGTQDAAVQRWLQLAIQCCLDLGDALLGRLGQPEPPRYRDIFPALARANVIDTPLAQAMERLTDHRNALAHAYVDLSPDETWRWIREGLPALAEFAQKILQAGS
jgi:uncharacterized protein YutE (UPF0331/DUF86 family)